MGRSNKSARGPSEEDRKQPSRGPSSRASSGGDFKMTKTTRMAPKARSGRGPSEEDRGSSSKGPKSRPERTRKAFMMKPYETVKKRETKATKDSSTTEQAAKGTLIGAAAGASGRAAMEARRAARKSPSREPLFSADEMRKGEADLEAKLKKKAEYNEASDKKSKKAKPSSSAARAALTEGQIAKRGALRAGAKLIAKGAARLVPGLGAGLTAYEIGKYATKKAMDAALKSRDDKLLDKGGRTARRK